MMGGELWALEGGPEVQAQASRLGRLKTGVSPLVWPPCPQTCLCRVCWGGWACPGWWQLARDLEQVLLPGPWFLLL